MSGEFREMGRHCYMWCALEDMAEAAGGSSRVAQALRGVYIALTPLEKAVAWEEARDSGEAQRMIAVTRAADAAIEALDDLKAAIKAEVRVVEELTRRAKSEQRMVGD